MDTTDALRSLAELNDEIDRVRENAERPLDVAGLAGRRVVVQMAGGVPTNVAAELARIEALYA